MDHCNQSTKCGNGASYRTMRCENCGEILKESKSDVVCGNCGQEYKKKIPV